MLGKGRLWGPALAWLAGSALPPARVRTNWVTPALLGHGVVVPEQVPLSPDSSECCCSSLPSEQRFKTALGHHGEQARQRERGEDPLQHEAQGAGESPGLSTVPDSLQARCSSCGETGVTMATPGCCSRALLALLAAGRPLEGLVEGGQYPQGSGLSYSQQHEP